MGPDIQYLNLLIARMYWAYTVLVRINRIKVINEKGDRKTGWDREGKSKLNAERKRRGKVIHY
jgi:hypothetical protein